MDDRIAKKRTKGVPVTNTDTGRTVYVLPETLKKHPDKFKVVPDDHAGDPRWRGKPKPPRKPKKPEKPEVPRESPPAPIKPRAPKKEKTETKPVTPATPAKPVKVTEPSPQRRWKKLKRLQPKVAAERVALRFLAAISSR